MHLVPYIKMMDGCYWREWCYWSRDKQLPVLFPKHRSIISTNQIKAKLMRDMSKDTMLYNPLRPVQFGRNLLFSLSVKVRLNANYSGFNVSSKYQYNANISLSSSNWQVSNLSIINNLIIYPDKIVTYPITKSIIYSSKSAVLELLLNYYTGLVSITMWIQRVFYSPTCQSILWISCFRYPIVKTVLGWSSIKIPSQPQVCYMILT